jgi:hypothetical protein
MFEVALPNRRGPQTMLRQCSVALAEGFDVTTGLSVTVTEKLIGRSNQPLSKSFLVRTRTLSTARISVTRKLAMAAARLNIGGMLNQFGIILAYSGRTSVSAGVFKV